VRSPRGIQYYLAASVSIIAFLVYVPCLKNGFVNWDDNTYILENSHIRSLSPDFFQWAFFDFYASNWHPLTWISHAIDYAIWGLNPLGHHLSSLILHSANTFLLVLLVVALMGAYKESAKGNTRSPALAEWDILFTAAVTGLLFGLHPIHVESVAWVAERKDLLCALFFLLSILAYAKDQGAGYRVQGSEFRVQSSGVRSRESGVGSQGPGARGQESEDSSKDTAGLRKLFINKHYLFTLGFFILALMSKPMAVTLPFVLLLLDWFPLNRIRSAQTFRRSCLEKIPFFVLSGASSLVTILAQRTGAAIWEQAPPIFIRIPVAFESLLAYLGKIILPLNLLPFYPYPLDASIFSLKYAVATVVVVAITLACLMTARKQRLWLVVWFYFGVTLLPVLGFVQVGGQSMADRYAYLPSIGPFIIIGLGATRGLTRLSAGKANAVLRRAALALLIPVFVYLSYLTVTQTGRWKDDLTLWTYVIDKESTRVLIAYYNRGAAYVRAGRIPEAIEDFNTVIALNYQEDSKAYINRGLAFYQVGQMERAIADLRKACELGDTFGCQTAQYLVTQSRPPSANRGGNIP